MQPSPTTKTLPASSLRTTLAIPPLHSDDTSQTCATLPSRGDETCPPKNELWSTTPTAVTTGSRSRSKAPKPAMRPFTRAPSESSDTLSTLNPTAAWRQQRTSHALMSNCSKNPTLSDHRACLPVLAASAPRKSTLPLAFQAPSAAACST